MRGCGDYFKDSILSKVKKTIQSELITFENNDDKVLGMQYPKVIYAINTLSSWVYTIPYKRMEYIMSRCTMKLILLINLTGKIYFLCSAERLST